MVFEDCIYQVKGWFVSFYIIYDETSTVLIDGGFIGDKKRLKHGLKAIDRTLDDIDLILLTHGHLDHTANISYIKQYSGAKVVGSVLDKEHIAGRYPYTGKTRICGWLEKLGRGLVRYKPFDLDLEAQDGQTIDVAGGIRVVHLPGHTKGHCGYYHEQSGILFTGDLYENSLKREGFSPVFLNTCPDYFEESVRKVLELNPNGILANHCDNATPQKQWERFKRFAEGLRIKV